MWAYRLTAPRTFERCEADTPLAPAGWLTLKPRHGGICGSDLPGFKGHRNRILDGTPANVTKPGFPLHEIVGEVTDDPTGTFPQGTRVVGWAGGFDAICETVTTPATSVVAIPESIELGDAVVLQPLACVLFTMERLKDVLPGARVAILGLGPIGLMFAHAARHYGASFVVGVDPIDRTADKEPYRLDEVVVATADRWAEHVPQEDWFDVVIEVVGHQVATLQDAIRVAARGGTVFCFGVPDDEVYPLPMMAFFRKNLRLLAGVIPDHAGSLQLAIDYAATYPELLRGSISHRFSVHDVQQAFDCAVAPLSDRRKVVLDY